tara:strand:- start:150 stop:593 length:444 start_codon:yes stop_codon:yes gene_type:complete
MYEVGQVLFLVLKNKQKIIPVRVMEQIVRRSIGSEKIQYLVKLPGRQETVSLESLSSEVYVNITDVKGKLYHTITSLIDTMAEKAVAMAVKEFEFDPHADLDIAAVPAFDSTQPINGEKFQVEFPDGVVGNVTMPSSYDSDIPIDNS